MFYFGGVSGVDGMFGEGDLSGETPSLIDQPTAIITPNKQQNTQQFVCFVFLFSRVPGVYEMCRGRLERETATPRAPLAEDGPRGRRCHRCQDPEGPVQPCQPGGSQGTYLQWGGGVTV